MLLEDIKFTTTIDIFIVFGNLGSIKGRVQVGHYSIVDGTGLDAIISTPIMHCN